MIQMADRSYYIREVKLDQRTAQRTGRTVDYVAQDLDTDKRITIPFPTREQAIEAADAKTATQPQQPITTPAAESTLDEQDRAGDEFEIRMDLDDDLENADAITAREMARRDAYRPATHKLSDAEVARRRNTRRRF